MKTALLINPWIYDFAAYDLWLQPWGLMKLATVLQLEGYQIQLLDLLDRHHPLLPGKAVTKENGTGPYLRQQLPKPPALANIPRKWSRYGLPLDLFQKALPEDKPDVILVSSAMTYWYPGVFSVIAILRKRWPDARIILGGTYATLMPEHAATSGADLIIGNRELELLSRELQLSRDYTQQELLDAQLCLDFHPDTPYAILKLSQGCPYRCDYCAQQLLSPQFLQRSMDSALLEMEQLTGRGLRHFAIYDDALLHDRDYLHTFLDRVLQLQLPLHFHTPNGMHARFLDHEIAQLLRRSGFVKPVLSLETAVETSWHTKISVPELETAIDNLRKAGYQQGEYLVYLLLGAPGSSEESMLTSIELVHKLGAQISLSEFSPIPGTILGNRYPEAIAEPLLQNNTIFPAVSSEMMPIIERLKKTARKLNGELRR